MKFNWKKIGQAVALLLTLFFGSYGTARLEDNLGTSDPAPQLVTATPAPDAATATYLVHATEDLKYEKPNHLPDLQLPSGFVFKKDYVFRITLQQPPNLKQLVYEVRKQGAKGRITIVAVYQADKLFFGYEPKPGEPPSRVEPSVPEEE